MEVEIKVTHPRFVFMEICDRNQERWNLAIVYASPSMVLRRKLWATLRDSVLKIGSHWTAIGDFNSVATIDEVSNKDTFSDRRCSEFNDWIFEEGLVDLGYVGQTYTWMRGTEASTFRGARLDRVLSSVEWMEMFPHATNTHLPA